MPDREPLMVTEEERDAICALLQAWDGVELEGTGGMQVRRNGRKISIVNLLRRAAAGAPPGAIVVSGLITGNAAGKEKYTGKSFQPIESDVSASSDLSEADLGGLAATNDCLVCNVVGLGSSTTGHDVNTATNKGQFAIYFVGLQRWINADGTKVIEAAQFFIGC